MIATVSKDWKDQLRLVTIDHVDERSITLMKVEERWPSNDNGMVTGR